jgi:hypothetical protein
VKRLLTFILYKSFGKLEPLFKRLSELCSRAAFKFREWNWHSKMPYNVRIGEIGLPNYYCPFCDTDLDYRFDFDGILCGVCWTCNKAWHERWDNSECPDYDNCNWPTKANVLPDPPSAFWEDSLYHFVKTREDGLTYDEGKADNH